MYFEPNRLCVAFLVFCNTFTFSVPAKAKCCIENDLYIYSLTQLYSSFMWTQANMMQYLFIMYLDFLLLHIHNSVHRFRYVLKHLWVQDGCMPYRTLDVYVQVYSWHPMWPHMGGLKLKIWGEWCAISVCSYAGCCYDTHVKSPVGNAPLRCESQNDVRHTAAQTHFHILLELSSGWCHCRVNLCGRIYIYMCECLILLIMTDIEI